MFVLAFGLGGDSLSLYRVTVRVGVRQLSVNDLTAENKLALCNKILHDIDKGLALYAQVGRLICISVCGTRTRLYGGMSE